MKRFRRLPQALPRDAVSVDEQTYHDRVTQRTNRVHGAAGLPADYFGALLQSPPLAAVLTDFGTLIRTGGLRGTYTDAERELMDIALAVELGSNAILQVHIPDALAVGVPIRAVRALVDRREDTLTQDELALVTYAREYVKGTVTDRSYAALRQRLGDRGALEFTVLIGFLLMTIRLWQALGVPEPTPDEIQELLNSVETKAHALPDPDARIG